MKTAPLSLLARTLGAIAIAILCACAAAPEYGLLSKAEIDAMEARAIEQLRDPDSGINEDLSTVAGYMVIELEVAKVPVLGRGRGVGVIVDNRDQSRHYVEVSQFEIGGGLGVRKNLFVILFENPKLLDKAGSGAWHYQAGVEAGASEQTETQVVTMSGKGYRAYQISEGALVVSITVRAARSTPLKGCPDCSQ